MVSIQVVHSKGYSEYLSLIYNGRMAEGIRGREELVFIIQSYYILEIKQLFN